MPVYDLECRVSFGRRVEGQDRIAFNQAAGVSHPGWHGPSTVVSWKGLDEAEILLVLTAPRSVEGPPEEALCKDAEARIRGWVEAAGLTGPSPDAVTVRCEATARP